MAGPDFELPPDGGDLLDLADLVAVDQVPAELPVLKEARYRDEGAQTQHALSNPGIPEEEFAVWTLILGELRAAGIYDNNPACGIQLETRAGHSYFLTTRQLRYTPSMDRTEMSLEPIDFMCHGRKAAIVMTGEKINYFPGIPGQDSIEIRKDSAPDLYQAVSNALNSTYNQGVNEVTFVQGILSSRQEAPLPKEQLPI